MRFAMAQSLFKKTSFRLPAPFRIRLRETIRRGRGILGGIFLRGRKEARRALRDLLRYCTPVRRTSCSYPVYLARLRTLQGALAAQLGSLAKDALGQGLREAARQHARQAFAHWCRARRAEGKLLRKMEDPLRQAIL